MNISPIKYLRKLRSKISDRFSGYSFFDFKRKDYCVVLPFTGTYNFGFADRLRHCLAVYIFCKDNRIPFRIYHTSPFRLEEILVPNKYDWHIDDNDFSRSMIHTKVKMIGSYYKALGISEEDEGIQQKKMLEKLVTNKNIQYHILGNIHSDPQRWAEAFSDLFQPSAQLNAGLENLNLPDRYNAITLRFQNLLGDFKEGIYPEADENQKKVLIEKCLNKISEIYQSTPSEKRLPILVTSDSVNFLKEADKLDYVKIIPGEMAHPGYAKGKSTNVFLKSFLDLFALSRAESLTLLRTGDMYNSGFPEFAARIGNKPYSIIQF